jgi:hypothetical protein
MNRYSSSELRSHAEKHHRLLQTTRLLPEQEYPEGEMLTFCVACLLAGFTRPAVGHTSHPEYRRLALCSDCIAHYDRAILE